MAQERLAMKDIKELLRLRFGLGLSQRQTAKASGFGRTTVQEYEERAKRGNLTSVEEFEKLSADEIYERLGFKCKPGFATVPLSAKPLPNWKQIREDICRHKHVTMLLLWTEYKEQHPEGYQYSQFCDLYKQWSKKLSLTMRQEHKAGEKIFIDYAGSTVDIVDSDTGAVKTAQIFVSCLGGSSYVYAEATMSQGMCDWLMSHRRMVEFYGGVSEILVPDNLKSGVTKADRYEAGVNKAYVEFCEHYGTCVIPARSGKPKDKAKVEVSVQIVSRWIIAALRNRTFYSLAELNEAIRELLIRINNRKMRHIGKSRLELFDSLEKTLLKPLPSKPYEFGEWKKVTANIDYHIEFSDVFYSVPHHLTGESLWVRGTNSVIEIYKNLERIASHRRSFRKGKFITDPSHRPVTHQEHAKWTPERIVSWATSKGDIVGEFVKKLIASKAHAEQGFRSSLGIIRLADKYGEIRLRAACAKAIRIESINYQTVKNMLVNNMESLRPTDEELQKSFFEIDHENVRGESYYH
jgi:transposase